MNSNENEETIETPAKNSDYPDRGIPIINIDSEEYSKYIINKARVDFGNNRIVQQHVKIVQYDSTLRMVAVDLYVNGFEYNIPSSIVNNGRMYVRWGKPDHTFYNAYVAGINSEANVAYFEINEQMTVFAGPFAPILVLTYEESQAGSSPIPIDIEKNPVQNGDIESMAEYPYIEEEIRALNARVDDLEDESFIHYGHDEGEHKEGVIWLEPINEEPIE